MNILKSIGDRFRRNSVHAIGQSTAGYSGVVVNDVAIAKYQATATVFTCADLISKAIAAVNFKCKDEFWNNAFNRPNDHQSRYDFFYSLAWDSLIFGNSYTLRSERNSAESGILSPLDSANVEPTGKLSPKYNMIDSGKEYDSNQIIHVRHGGGSGLKAISRVSAGLSRIRALEACDQEINDVFTNGINAQYVLSGGHANEPELIKIMKAIKKGFGLGGKRRGGVIALTGGFKIESVSGPRPADSDLRELRSDLIREIAALFGVPPFAVGGASDTKFTNTVARHQQTNSYALMPLSTNIAEKFSHALKAEVTFDEESIIASDFAMKLEFAIQSAGGAVLSPDEAREAWLDRGKIKTGELLRGGWNDRPSSGGGRDNLPESTGDDE